jgi:hypothetical protein
MPETATELLRMPSAELDELFGRCPPGPVPVGPSDGRMLIGGGLLRPVLAGLLRATAWKGKVVAADGHSLRNRVGPMGRLSVPATLSIGASWWDGQPCIVVDYSRTSWVAHWIRDEIRLVDRRLYVGIVFFGRTRIKNVWFTLRFPA